MRGRRRIFGSGKDFAFRKNMLFESLREKLESYPELNSMLYSLLFTEKRLCIIIMRHQSILRPCLAL